jgi:hypothetical protein
LKQNKGKTGDNSHDKTLELVANKDNHETNHPEELLDEEDLRQAREFKKAVQRKSGKDRKSKQGEDDDDDDADDDDENVMGPMPLVNPDSKGAPGSSSATHPSQKAYGKALLPGEGEALAAYVQQNLRIPRRGEIGYDADELPAGTRSSMDGYVSEKINYKQWLSKASDETLKDVLGVNRFKMFKNGDYKIDSFISDGKLVTVKQLQEQLKRN